MGKKGDDTNIFVGEIWSLIALIVVILSLLMYLSSDTLVIGRQGLEQNSNIDAQATQAASSIWTNFMTYIARNLSVVIISGYIVLSMLFIILGVHLILLFKRKKRFRRQNQESRQKIQAYQQSLNPSKT